MGIRFIHTADWQLGKAFARFDPALSGRLRAERQDVIARIGTAARDADCRHILVAGDVWDTTLPGHDVLRQPLDIMAEFGELIWWLLPGNHDRDDADGLWDRVEACGHDHIRPQRRAEPVEMEPGVWLLPAPWQRLHHGEDLTRWMDGAQTPDGAIRIGLAHGGIRSFGTNDAGKNSGETDEIIPPDRASTAQLDYLALGDWHGRSSINQRTHYSGTPEPDRHKVGDRGQILCVEIASAGRNPIVTDIATARFDWPVLTTPLRTGEIDEAIAAIRERVDAGQAARDTLVNIRVSGSASVAEWARFEQFVRELSERCAHLEMRGQDDVDLRIVAEDLDALDAQGSVRAAAETLDGMRQDPTLSQAQRIEATDALRQLFAFAATDAAS
ncbi:exonuclease SbcCD subunit D [Algimonas porphyrae]|uniref:Exonuclease n=1 Tax=Algimonas porphyrae TaxID=1128113 RepID=A0ABQ5V5K6_9PROT|nr:metallophosphoesterase [Algimonas porphyrae]GLQ21989.1 exonuclease [Algimonas porphyrae]